MNELFVVRNTTQKIAVSLVDASGNPYVLTSGQTLRFGVKTTPHNSQYLLTKDFSTLEDGKYVFTISPSDTAGLDFGNFYYDIGLAAGSAYYMVVPCHDCPNFHLTPNITAPGEG